LSESRDTPYLVHVSPHRREGESVRLVMLTTTLALLPALAVGTYVFGWRALWVTALSFVACTVVEAAVLRLRTGRLVMPDGSAGLSGVLLAFVLPPDVSWYVIVVGAIVAMGLAKHAFGGLGANFFNPALVARAFLQFAFPAQVSLAKWPILAAGAARLARVASDAAEGVDAVTRATPLKLLADNPGVPWSDIRGASAFGPPLVWLLPAGAAIALFAVLALAAGAGLHLAIAREKRLAGVFGVGVFLLLGAVPTGNVSFGMIPGCIGETSAWALLLGGLVLVHYRCIKWQLPAVYVATVAVLVLLLPVRTGDGAWSGLLAGSIDFERVLVHVFAGGLFLGAFFMITDMVTSPMTTKGQVVFGALAGLLVALIRLYGGYPEGVCYSILLVNAARPMIDRYTVPRVFGARPKEREDAAAVST
jgi:electron transport complex protein RnfD